MATTLPSITNIYSRAFQLYGKSYIDVLPLVIVYVLFMYLIDRFLPITPAQAQPFAWAFVLNIVLQMVNSLVFFSCILYGVNQKYNNLPFNYADVIQKGGQRSLPVLLSAVILMIPPIIMSFILGFISGFASAASKGSPEIDLLKIISVIFVIIAIVVVIAWVIMTLYFYVSSAQIVLRGANAVDGLRQSWKLVRGHWWKTFAILLIVMLAVGLLNFLLIMLIGPLAKQIASLIVYPLGAAVMLVYNESLEKAL